MDMQLQSERMASSNRHREKRTSLGVMTVCTQNSGTGQVVITIPKKARDRGNVETDPGDELEVIEVVDEQSGETRLELQPVE